MFKRYKGTYEIESDTASAEPTHTYSGPSPHPYVPPAPQPPKRDAPPRIAEELPRRPAPSNWKEPTIEELAPEEDVQELDCEEPETTLGEGVIFKGELSFQRLLRIDGYFEGELQSDGKLIVGPKGIVKSNIHMREAVIDGRIEGSLYIKERLELRGDASVHGDIIAQSLTTDDGVTIDGHVQITPAIRRLRELEASKPLEVSELVTH